MRVGRTAGNGWGGHCWFQTTGLGFDYNARRATIPDPDISIGEWTIVTFDMHNLTLGGSAWLANNINGIAIQLGFDAADSFYIDWIAIGQVGPGASRASLVHEESVRADADSALAQDILALTAGTAGSFDAAYSWNFDESVDGWTAGNATLIHASDGQHVTLDATGTPPYMVSPTMSPVLFGATYRYVRARVIRQAGTGWGGRVWFQTSVLGFDYNARYKTIAEPDELASTGVAIIEFDMAALTAGGTAWQAGNISAIALQLGASSADTFHIDWIAIGRKAPPTSWAALSRESSARITAVSAVAEDVTTLTSQVGGHQTSIETNAITVNGLRAQYTVKIDNNGYVSGYGLASEAVNGAIVSTFLVRANVFAIGEPGASSTIPFIVSAGSVYIANALIQNAAINEAKIGNLEVGTLKVKNGAITSIESAVSDGEINGSGLQIQYVRAVNGTGKVKVEGSFSFRYNSFGSGAGLKAFTVGLYYNSGAGDVLFGQARPRFVAVSIAGEGGGTTPVGGGTAYVEGSVALSPGTYTFKMIVTNHPSFASSEFYTSYRNISTADVKK
jgi:hypothetical protein